MFNNYRAFIAMVLFTLLPVAGVSAQTTISPGSYQSFNLGDLGTVNPNTQQVILKLYARISNSTYAFYPSDFYMSLSVNADSTHPNINQQALMNKYWDFTTKGGDDYSWGCNHKWRLCRGNDFSDSNFMALNSPWVIVSKPAPALAQSPFYFEFDCTSLYHTGSSNTVVITNNFTGGGPSIIVSSVALEIRTKQSPPGYDYVTATPGPSDPVPAYREPDLNSAPSIQAYMSANGNIKLRLDSQDINFSSMTSQPSGAWAGGGTSVLPTPLVRYSFNGTGTTVANSGSLGAAANMTLKNGSDVVTDVHSGTGTGITGLTADRALDNYAKTSYGSNGNYGDAPNNSALISDKSFTVAGWVKTNTAAISTSGYLCQDMGFALWSTVGYPSGGNTKFTLTVTNGSSWNYEVPSAAYPIGDWFFIAVTWDGTDANRPAKFYVGTKTSAVTLVGTVNNTACASTTGASALPLRVGANNSISGNRAYPGYLDEFAIWASNTDGRGVLTMDQVEQYRKATVISTPLVRYSFNGTGTTVANSGSLGTAANMTLKNGSDVVTDVHSGAGTGITGLAVDRALDNYAKTSYGSNGNYGDAPNNSALVSDKSFTVAGWVKTNTTATGNVSYICQDMGFSLWSTAGYPSGGNTKFTLTISNGSSWNYEVPSAAYPIGDWVFIAVTWDGTDTNRPAKFYVATKTSAVTLVGTVNNTGCASTTGASALPLRVGANNSVNGNRAYPGYLDEFAIWASNTDSGGALPLDQLERYRLITCNQNTVYDDTLTPLANNMPQACSWAGTGYNVSRTVTLLGDHIKVADTITNTSGNDNGVMYDNQAFYTATPAQILLAGIPTWNSGEERKEPGHPSSIAIFSNSIVGMFAEDDIFHMHAVSYTQGNQIGLVDRELGFGGTYNIHTLEWSIYALSGTNQYWDIINRVRYDWRSNITIPGPAMSDSGGLYYAHLGRQSYFNDLVAYRDLNWLCCNPPTLAVPDGRCAYGKSMDLVSDAGVQQWWSDAKAWVDLLHLNPSNPSIVTLAYYHPTICTAVAGVYDPLTTYSDSRILDSSGNPVPYNYQTNSWNFVPMTNNSYGTALYDLAQRLVNTAPGYPGFDGIFMDEISYGAFQTYDNDSTRWDGCTINIDPITHTLVVPSGQTSAKKSYILLLMQPWKQSIVQYMQSNGKTVIGNGPAAYTRTMLGWSIPCITEDLPAQSSRALTKQNLSAGWTLAVRYDLADNCERGRLRGANSRLNYGCIYLPWIWTDPPTQTVHYAARMYPVTPIAFYEGVVIGQERIITNRSGKFGWLDNSLCDVYEYDEMGLEVANPQAQVVTENGSTLMYLRMPSDHLAILIRR